MAFLFRLKAKAAFNFGGANSLATQWLQKLTVRFPVFVALPLFQFIY